MADAVTSPCSSLEKESAKTGIVRDLTSADSHGAQLEVDGVDIHDCVIDGAHVQVTAHALRAR